METRLSDALGWECSGSMTNKDLTKFTPTSVYNKMQSSRKSFCFSYCSVNVGRDCNQKGASAFKHNLKPMVVAMYIGGVR